jgi:hypothetical protein
MMRDLHQALKFETIANSRAPKSGVDFALVRGQWSKDEIAFGLHAAPNQFTTSGVQTPDFMSLLGFQRSGCQFVDRRECFSRWVPSTFDVGLFATRFDEAFRAFEQSERDLQSCGIFFEQLEGWGYFFGRNSRGRERRTFTEFGDGHTVAESKELKRSEDAAFQYRFIWVVTGRGEKGWITHYHPQNPPLSVELEMAFKFLGLRTFRSCSHFDFEPCSWSALQYAETSESFFDRNTEVAHQWFDNHAGHFSPGIENLLTAHALLEPFGMKLLPIPEAGVRLKEELGRHTVQAKAVPKPSSAPDLFDVAVSFAGTERKLAEQLAGRVRDAGFSVFYDGFYPEDLWGKDFVETFHQIYSKRARYCVIFVSREYNNRAWTIYERRSAQERMLKERGQEYILPIKVEDVELPGMPSTIGYVSIADLPIDKIADLLLKKLGK